MGDDALGTLAQVWRYPVKSLQGERVPSSEVESRGLVGDRLWAVRTQEGRLGSGKSSRRFTKVEGLLGLGSALPEGVDAPRVTWTDGRALDVGDPALDAALTELAGRPVQVAREGEVDHHDDGPVHLLTTSSLRWLAGLLGHEAPPARFRPNLVVETAGDGPVEQGWVGQEVAVGEVVLRVVAPMPRCVMTTMEQRGLAEDRAVLRTLTEHADADFGVLAEVVRPGRVVEGDEVRRA